MASTSSSFITPYNGLGKELVEKTITDTLSFSSPSRIAHTDVVKVRHQQADPRQRQGGM